MTNNRRNEAWLLLLAVASLSACVASISTSALVEGGGGHMVERQNNKPYTGRVTETHPDGQRSLAGHYRDGKRHGAWTTWYPDGTLQREEHYQDGKLHGPVRSFWSNGKKMVQGTFRDNLRQGAWAEWDAKGQPIFRAAYDKGQKHGPWKSWHGNGKLEEQGAHQQGKKHGTWAFHDTKGKLLRKEEFDGGSARGKWNRDGAPPPGKQGSARAGAPPSNKERVSVVMYVMSQCPYGVTTVDAFLPVLAEMGDHVDFRLEYIGEDRNGKLTSMHGDPEVQGNIHQLCARTLYPAQKQWTAFVACENTIWRKLPAGWEGCARKAGMDVGRMGKCIQGSQGQDLLRASFQASKAANASGSPTIVIGGKEFSGERTKVAFMRTACHSLTHKAAACATLPPPHVEPVVLATIISDKRCPGCDKRIKEIEGIMASRFFTKLRVSSRLDWTDPRARALYKKLKLKALPVMLFEGGVEKAKKFKHHKRFITRNGPYWQLGGIGVSHDPLAEICDNKIDDTGNGKADCRDPGCKGTLVCRRERKRMVTVFIVSRCPFAVKGVNSMKEVLKNFGRRVKLKIHFIGGEKDGEPTSMHGRAEVEENIRMLCAAKRYRKRNKYLDYIWCRFKGDSWRTADWKKCAVNGISAQVIERCASGPGKKMLLQDIKVAKKLGISASPSWLANNRYKFTGVTAEKIKTELCKRNPKLKNCDKKLTSSSAPSGGG